MAQGVRGAMDVPQRGVLSLSQGSVVVISLFSYRGNVRKYRGFLSSRRFVSSAGLNLREHQLGWGGKKISMNLPCGIRQDMLNR